MNYSTRTINQPIRTPAFAGAVEPALRTRVDGYLLAATFALLAISVLMVFSTTAVSSLELSGSATTVLQKHLLHILVGLLIFGICSRLNPYSLRKLAVPMMGFAIFLLIAVAIPAIGHDAGGARRWLQLGPLRMQPGELGKIIVVIYFAAYIERNSQYMKQFIAGALLPFLILSVIGSLLLLEPDFGSTVVIMLVVFAQLFSVSKTKHLLVPGAVAGLCATALVYFSPYRMKRFTAYLDPFNDPSESGYQLIQSLIAVGSGGFWGEGLGAGTQKLYYLPAAHTDFIFAVISEELGLLGALSVLILFLLILIRGIKITRKLSSEPFLASLAIGCTMLIVLPALLNMGVVLGLLPTKGMVLPFIAYGGTAMLVHLAAMGTLVRLSAMVR